MKIGFGISSNDSFQEMSMSTFWGKTKQITIIIISSAVLAQRVVMVKKTHYENTPVQIYWKFYKQKKFSDKNSDIFHISAQNIDCGYSLEPLRRGGSNEYPQSMFLTRNKKNNVYPCNLSFTI